MSGPLAGYRIVDCTAMVTGPQATVILADQGAEVIKVEPPGVGDVMRYLGTQRGGVSSFFAVFNRGKRSVALNLRDERGREVLERLVGGADVFVQNFRPGVAERLGIDEASLRAVRDDLVYVSISAFGDTGPWAQRPAFDHILQGFTGMAWAQAEPGARRPAYVRNATCDKVTGLTVAQAVTAALLARERGAGGQHVRVSMLEATLSFLWPDVFANQTPLEDDAVVLPTIATTYRFVETRDGFISVAAVTDAQWAGVARAVGRAELAEDPRFATMAGRALHFEELVEELGGGRIDLPTDEALERLGAEDVPCGPILRLEEVPCHPQVVARGALVESEHPQMGRMRQAAPAARFGATPAAVGSPAPALGEHTDEVLRAAGFGERDIEELRAKGAVG